MNAKQIAGSGTKITHPRFVENEYFGITAKEKACQSVDCRLLMPFGYFFK